MRDKEARLAICSLAGHIGYDVRFNKNSFDNVFNAFDGRGLPSGVSSKVERYNARIAAIEKRFADQDAEAAKKIEESKPVCKSCGQKIQEGLLPGQVEQVSAAVSGGYSSGKRTKR